MHSVVFVFADGQSGQLVCETDFAVIPGVENPLRSAQRWLRIPDPKVEDASQHNHLPLEMNVLDFEKLSWQLKVTARQVKEQNTISPLMKAFARSIELDPKGVQRDLGGLPTRLIKFDPVQPFQQMVQKTAYHYKVIGSPYILEIARYDRFPYHHAKPGAPVTAQDVGAPGGPVTEYGATIFSNEWDIVLGQHANLEIGVAADWEPNISTFFPPNVKQAQIESNGFQDFIEAVETVGSIIADKSQASEAKQYTSRSEEEYPLLQLENGPGPKRSHEPSPEKHASAEESLALTPASMHKSTGSLLRSAHLENQVPSALRLREHAAQDRAKSNRVADDRNSRSLTHQRQPEEASWALNPPNYDKDPKKADRGGSTGQLSAGRIQEKFQPTQRQFKQPQGIAKGRTLTSRRTLRIEPEEEPEEDPFSSQSYEDSSVEFPSQAQDDLPRELDEDPEIPKSESGESHSSYGSFKTADETRDSEMALTAQTREDPAIAAGHFRLFSSQSEAMDIDETISENSLSRHEGVRAPMPKDPAVAAGHLRLFSTQSRALDVNESMPEDSLNTPHADRVAAVLKTAAFKPRSLKVFAKPNAETGLRSNAQEHKFPGQKHADKPDHQEPSLVPISKNSESLDQDAERFGRVQSDELARETSSMPVPEDIGVLDQDVKYLGQEQLDEQDPLKPSITPASDESMSWARGIASLDHHGPTAKSDVVNSDEEWDRTEAPIDFPKEKKPAFVPNPLFFYDAE